MLVICVVLVIIPMLINVAFFTLLERKILGLGQERKGPNKVSLGGLFQPVADAVKLFSNEPVKPSSSSGGFWGSPLSALAVMLLLWTLTPFSFEAPEGFSSGILLMVTLSLGLYPLMMAGWFSNSKFSLIGSVRGVAQTLSYEVSLAIIISSLFLASGGFSLSLGTLSSSENWVWWAGAPLVGVWLMSCVAETNRTPFDFAEGESELVSGFNTEYSSGGFALIFMAEYGSILALAMLTLQLLGGSLGGVHLAAATVALSSWWVWIRATLPRLRYDMLMDMAWKGLLPLSLAMLLGLSIMNLNS